jgi:F-type H+-transporting ATPase subunit a
MGKGGNTSTANYFITPGLAACAFGAYHYLGVKEEYEHHHKGVGSWGGAIWAYMKNQIPSVPIFVLPLMVLIEIAAHIIRPCALAIRLCANMVAGHVMMAVLFGFTTVFTSDFIVGGALVSLVSVTAATLLTFLELLVAVIQAFVFTFLTTVFLSMAVHPNH